MLIIYLIGREISLRKRDIKSMIYNRLKNTITKHVKYIILLKHHFENQLGKEIIKA